MIQESIGDVLEGWLLRHPGPEQLNKKQSLQELRSWLRQHTVTWWLAEDPRRTVVTLSLKTPVTDGTRPLVESAAAQVNPESSTAVAESKGIHSGLWGSLRSDLAAQYGAAGEKGRRDRLRDMLPSRLSSCMAEDLSSNTEFRTIFATTDDPVGRLKPYAEEAARTCRSPAAERARNEFLARETLRQALTLPDDKTLIQLLQSAADRAMIPRRNWTRRDLQQTRRTLRELSDGRYQSAPTRLQDAATDELRTRALDCLVRGEPGRWTLPITSEDSRDVEDDFAAMLERVHRRALIRAKRDGLPDPESLASEIQISLIAKAQRHSIREYLASGELPSEDSREAWIGVAAAREYREQAGQQRRRMLAGHERLREIDLDQDDLDSKSHAPLPYWEQPIPVEEIVESRIQEESAPELEQLVRSEFQQRRTLYKSDEVLMAAIDFCAIVQRVYEPTELRSALQAVCPADVNRDLVANLCLAALASQGQDNHAGLALTNESINYGGGS